MGGAGIFQLARGSPAEGRSFPELHMGLGSVSHPAASPRPAPGQAVSLKHSQLRRKQVVSSTLETAGGGRAMEKLIRRRVWVSGRVKAHRMKELVKQVQCLPCKGMGRQTVVFHPGS